MQHFGFSLKRNWMDCNSTQTMEKNVRLQNKSEELLTGNETKREEDKGLCAIKTFFSSFWTLMEHGLLT